MPTRRFAIVTLLLFTTLACTVKPAIERLLEARQISADLLIQFTNGSDASNRAVMADTDEASVAFAREAEQAQQAVQTNIDTLGPILKSLDYAEESRLLDEFVSRFAEYRQLDKQILELAVENTNLKAQHLSFGPAQEAADSLRDSLESIAPLNESKGTEAKDTWRMKALIATVVAKVREIQALQAPHIASADDAAMTNIEKRMASAEAAARDGLKTLTPLVQGASRTRLTAAAAALDKFMGLNAEILALSRRNTNVRSLALSMNEKGKLITACEDSLHALRNALDKRETHGTR